MGFPAGAPAAALRPVMYSVRERLAAFRRAGRS
jgi:hypothetical protein